MPDSTTTKIPVYFTETTASHAFSQIRFAFEKFASTDVFTLHQKTLKKLKEQTEASLSKNALKDAGIDEFLQQKRYRSAEYAELRDAYEELKKMQKMLQGGELPITEIIKAAAASIKDVREKMGRCLQQEKADFHAAYKNACPDENKRIALWREKYEPNLKKDMMEPLDELSKKIDPDRLISQACIHYLDNLALGKAAPVSTYQHGETEEKFVPRSQYTDSNGKPMHVQYDKKNGGKVTKINVAALSGELLSGNKSGNIGDAIATTFASSGKSGLVKVAVPTTVNNILSGDMDPGVTQACVLFFVYLFNKAEKIHYKNQMEKAAVATGIPPENILFVDSNDKPIVLSENLMTKIREKQAAMEDSFAKHLASQEEGLNQQQLPTTPIIRRGA
jgi:hypothetical protein